MRINLKAFRRTARNPPPHRTVVTVVDTMSVTYAATYGEGFADHLPMARSALRRMGAAPARVGDFERAYVRGKRLRPIGADSREALARDVLERRLAAAGRRAVFAAELPSLSAGIGAGAFHALIRVAYGIADDDDREIAAGLAYWRDAALPLGAPLPAAALAVAPFDADASIARVRRGLGHAIDRLDARANIARLMAAVGDDPAFDNAAGDADPGDGAIAQLASVACRAFAATQNFTLLHAMTATHAVRALLAFAPDPATFRRDFWRAFAAAYVAAGAPPVPRHAAFAEAVAAAPPWTELLVRACASNDEHVIKAVFTAWSEDGVYHDALYRLAAARYLDRRSAA